MKPTSNTTRMRERNREKNIVEKNTNKLKKTSAKNAHIQKHPE